MAKKQDKAESTTSKFDVGNPEQLIYQNEMLKLTTLGGIKLDGLDRMRVTIKDGIEKLSTSAATP